MELGIVGLGRMGKGIALRLLEKGHDVVGFDSDSRVAHELATSKLKIARSMTDLVERLSEPRVVWLMLPAGNAVDDTLKRAVSELGTDAIVIDGGNSNYRDSMRRARDLASRGVYYVDVGTSGGVHGRSSGYCMTIGGDPVAVERLTPVFSALAPAANRGWGHVGSSGSGHFVKMIHNGIEYGLMQAYAEGFAVMEKKGDMNLDLGEIAEIWNNGSVIRSWLLELAAATLREDPSLRESGSKVADSGEGRWAAAEAVELDVPAPVMTLSLIARLQSRDQTQFSNKVLQAMRNAFGGHLSTMD